MMGWIDRFLEWVWSRAPIVGPIPVVAPMVLTWRTRIERTASCPGRVSTYVEVQGRDTLVDSQRCILSPPGHDGPCKRSLQEPTQAPGQAQAALIDRIDGVSYQEALRTQPRGDYGP